MKDPLAMVFLCVECGFRFATNQELGKHSRQEHRDNHRCRLCQYKSNHRGELLNHIRRKHYRPEDFPAFHECSTCSARFVVKQDVHQHLRAGHKNYTCNLCKTNFVQRSQLESHTKLVHSTDHNNNNNNNSMVVRKKKVKTSKVDGHNKLATTFEPVPSRSNQMITFPASAISIDLSNDVHKSVLFEEEPWSSSFPEFSELSWCSFSEGVRCAYDQSEVSPKSLDQYANLFESDDEEEELAKKADKEEAESVPTTSFFGLKRKSIDDPCEDNINAKRASK